MLPSFIDIWRASSDTTPTPPHQQPGLADTVTAPSQGLDTRGVARPGGGGVIVVAATQKPGADVVPSSLRDLFGFRLALRCNTPQASDTILGQGWASAGFAASMVPGAQRGVGYLLAEGERPQRVKSYCLDDEALAAIAERATARRADAWLEWAGSTEESTDNEPRPSGV
jgi:DNA segregation ATPase FtsK/SpoIIIE, S-DNA-T family